MPRFIIEVTHNGSKAECLRELEAFRMAGAHYLTNADWGCIVDDHRAWLTVDVQDEATAKLMVPPVVRHKAKITRTTKFTPDEIKAMAEQKHS